MWYNKVMTNKMSMLYIDSFHLINTGILYGKKNLLLVAEVANYIVCPPAGN